MKVVREVSRFGGGWRAKLRLRPKPWESNPLFRGSGTGYESRAINVTGGIACTKWPTELTGESPTSSATRLGGSR